MKKKILIINIILSAALLLLAYGPECVVNKGYYIGLTWYDGYDYSYGSYMDEFGWIMLGSLAVLMFLSFTKYYFMTIAPAIINLFVIAYTYFDSQGISNIYISESFIVVLIVIISICIVLNSAWAAKVYFTKIKTDKLNEISKKQETPLSNADELKKYKELLDSGVITQEEFDRKKKQLLGL